MTRILTFALIVLALGFGFSWLADRPGVLSIVWQGQLIEMSLMVAASIIAALVAAVMLVWWVVNAVWTSPNAARRYFRARKRDRGYQALSTGLIAAGAGNAILARKMTARTQGLLNADQEPLIHLLDAQADLIEGKYDEARRKFEAMARDPETRELGLRGLYIEARRQGAYEAAQQYAEDAAEKAPYLPWAAQATLENRCRNGQWDDAIRLLDQQKAASVIERGEAERLKAVLLTAKAGEKLESDPIGAREDAKHALKLAKSLVPAALIAARSYLREDNLRKAATVLEPVWKTDPHPQIAELYVRARSGDTAIDRLKRAERLESLKPNNIESLFAVAQAALDAKEFAKARAKAEAAARIEPRESIFLLMADIEEAETGDQGRVRYWMAQALRAPRDPAWVADGVVSEKWLPISPVTGRLDAFEWKAPFGQLEGPVEDLTIENAIAAAPARAEPEPVAKTIVVEAAPEPRAEPKPVPAAPIEVAPAVSVPKEKKPATIEAPAETNAADEKAEAVPFFGGAPDDPGVKKPGVEAEPKTRLKLF
ncbi:MULTISPECIES: heme biosynthesis protein HemY [Rhizobium/Agrobacterium group]|uniref:Heme biosynthesis protein HemY n=1 Tax=Rhizobium rhizogenes TaxID=359 RepID=A0A546XDE0_RHIRH|nr:MULTISPECIES: heme biosynthesis protein HemY [Rhizobium/Agrobacterium group]MCZ7487440.1 heme biosynthesis protein HemY [Rhizobium rhizogenes]TRA98763.1 heme biosynthesis protein HemY [Rhizobium rhizogenes]